MNASVIQMEYYELLMEASATAQKSKEEVEKKVVVVEGSVTSIMTCNLQMT